MKTIEIMLSMDGYNCSLWKRFSDTNLYMKIKDVKNLLNFFLSVYVRVSNKYILFKKSRGYWIYKYNENADHY